MADMVQRGRLKVGFFIFESLKKSLLILLSATSPPPPPSPLPLSSISLRFPSRKKENFFEEIESKPEGRGRSRRMVSRWPERRLKKAHPSLPSSSAFDNVPTRRKASKEKMDVHIDARSTFFTDTIDHHAHMIKRKNHT